LQSLNSIFGEGFVLTKLLQKENIKINCPHCKQEISDAWICKMESIIGIRYAYLCSNCQKLIGISSQKNTETFLIPPGSGDIESISQN